MSTAAALREPLLDQVIAETLTRLRSRQEFDNQTIDALTQLATSGDLSKARSVTSAIKVKPGRAPHEAPGV